MEMCIYCGHTMSTREESANHPNVCYRARRAIDNQMSSELAIALTRLTEVLERLEKLLSPSDTTKKPAVKGYEVL